MHGIWKLPILQWAYSKIDVLSFITVMPFYYHFFASHSRIIWFRFILKLHLFSIFYDLIASYYAKGKWQWRQGYSFCFESYHFLIRKCFFTPAYFSLFNLTCFFHRHWRFTGQQGKGGDHPLFLSTTSTRSETLRHLFATLHVR